MKILLFSLLQLLVTKVMNYRTCRTRQRSFLLIGMLANCRPFGRFLKLKIKISKFENIDFEIVVSRNPEPQDSFEHSLFKNKKQILVLKQEMFKTILRLRISRNYYLEIDIFEISISRCDPTSTSHGLGVGSLIFNIQILKIQNLGLIKL